PPLRCFLAGDGSLRAALAADLHRLGLETPVRMLGQLEDPRTLLWALDVFVMPSLHEGLGVAALEAMACGLPAIVTASGGLGETVEDGRSGVKVPPADAGALAQAILRLASNPQARATMGAAARAIVAERFGMDAMARRTVELYRTCIAKTGRNDAKRVNERCGV
ncbi:MAG: glycosyltransferase, partial [Candidatus Binataceae bacterium]